MSPQALLSLSGPACLRGLFFVMLSLRGEPMSEAPMTDDTDAKARATAHALIQGYLGPDHKVIDMAAFYSALVQALKEAHGRS